MSKKKWRVKTLEELKATKDLVLKGARIFKRPDGSGNSFLVDRMEYLHGKEFKHDFKKSYDQCIDGFYIEKWMCKKVKDESEFKQGESVQVRNGEYQNSFENTNWTKADYIATYKGKYIVMGECGASVWGEIRKCE